MSKPATLTRPDVAVVYPAIMRIVKTWPGHFETARANALGLTADENFDAVIREYVRENPDAVKLPVTA